MDNLMAMGEPLGRLLGSKNQTVAVAESSAGGLISAALLAVAGASAYFRGGGVIYTHYARSGFLDLSPEALEGIRPSSEAYALVLARAVRERLHSTWGCAETGAAGPTGNRYGDAAGHTCIALSGPVEKTMTLETAQTDREANMWAFARAALQFFEQSIVKA